MTVRISGGVFGRIYRSILRRTIRPVEMDPVAGYDLWSSTYDDETENLLVELDERLFGRLLAEVGVRERVVTDVGCGTGRHWKTILNAQPSHLVGYDPSAGMLTKLRLKHPGATIFQSAADRLAETPDEGCDIVISTLALCHVPALDTAFAEWSRALRPGGDVLLTDYHPTAASRGCCSFRSGGRLVAVEHYVHSLATVESTAGRHGLKLVRLEETAVDDSMKQRFAARNMLKAFDQLRGTPLIYGIHFRKAVSPSPGAAKPVPGVRP